MDANQTKFWMLADERDWSLAEDSNLAYDVEDRCLRLASQRTLDSAGSEFGDGAPGVRTIAVKRLDRIPQARDAYGGRAFWSTAEHAVLATGAVPHAIAIFKPPPEQTPTDLAMGYDGVLYIALDGGVVLQDRRERWSSVGVRANDFVAWRLAADPSGGIWALDRTTRKLARVRGLPLPDRPFGDYSPNTFRPVEEDPDPPRLNVVESARWEDGEQPVAIASSPQGRLAVLNWVSGKPANIRCLNEDDTWGPPTELQAALHPYSFAWVSEKDVAVLLVDFRAEAPVFPLRPDATAAPIGDFYPLHDHDGGPYLRGLGLPPHYPTDAGSTGLHHLSLPSYAVGGQARNSANTFDSGEAQTDWHRLYLEARFPDRCGIVVYVAANDAADDPIADEDWHEHRFGPAPANGDGRVPHGAWVSYPSEIPHHAGLAGCPCEANRAGLFTVLIQRSNRRTRTLRGRFLHLRVKLTGDGRSTPKLWALRAYAPRFSYLNNYLPALYRESVFGDLAEEVTTEPATGPDFLERMLSNFEGVLTTIEDRIASAHVLMDPRSAPVDALPWLASWIGLGLEPGYPEERKRQLIQVAPKLFKRRGTYEGLKLALNVATGGAVDGGEIVIVEDFRLRRTFATILGADLADEDDPLLGGLVASGNSYVGDTLVLGDESRKEFLAVFAAELDKTAAEQSAIDAFLDRLAFRTTVLVHQDIEPQDLGIIRRVVELETPAHVLTRVVPSSRPFLVAIASLVGVDSYLGREPETQPVRIGHSRAGVRDRILRPASLDPRFESGRSGRLHNVNRPVADAGDDQGAEAGDSFTLDGSRSRASAGLELERFIWTLLE